LVGRFVGKIPVELKTKNMLQKITQHSNHKFSSLKQKLYKVSINLLVMIFFVEAGSHFPFTLWLVVAIEVFLLGLPINLWN
jgi:hypothetical protein